MKKYIPLWIKCPIAVLFRQVGQFPLSLVWRNMLWSFTQNRKCTDAVKNKAYIKAQKAVYRYLDRKYGSCVEQRGAEGSRGVQVENAPIWVFWWQGMQDAPYIIKSCIMNIQKNAGNHPVHIVDCNNYREFAQIPEHIERKVQSGKMSLTHFSDYLRMNLLANHGGLWIDGSIFVKTEIDRAVFEQPLWTMRNPGQDPTNISNWNWTIGVLGGWKDHVLFHSVSEVLSRYWNEHDLVADYFMMDCIMKIVYDKNPAVRHDIDAVVPNNDRFYWLQERANQELDLASYQEELKSETWLYKISWKGEYVAETPEGSDTFYAQWRNDFGVRN